MTVSRFLVRKACVREPELCAAVIRDEFDRHDGFGPFGCGGEPCQFHKLIAFEPEEPPIVRMSLSFEMRFEVEDRVDVTFHQYRSWCRKPAIELLRPCSEEGTRGRGHRTLSIQPKRPC